MCTLERGDAELFCGWMETQAGPTHLDPKVLGYPRACMVRMAKGDETVALVPVQPVLMLESLAKSPELSSWGLTLALVELDKLAEQAMNSTGMCEAYFLTDVPKFAETCESRGWTKCMYDPERKTWLMKKQIEPPQCD